MSKTDLQNRNKPIVDRPPKSIADYAKMYSIAAIETLAECLESESYHVRVAAANALLDRGFGRPKQSRDLNLRFMRVDDLDSELSEEEKEALEQDAMEQYGSRALLEGEITPDGTYTVPEAEEEDGGE